MSNEEKNTWANEIFNKHNFYCLSKKESLRHAIVSIKYAISLLKENDIQVSKEISLFDQILYEQTEILKELESRL